MIQHYSKIYKNLLNLFIICASLACGPKLFSLENTSGVSTISLQFLIERELNSMAIMLESLIISDEEKIGQLMIIELRRHSNGSPVLSLNDQERELLQELQPGGVILYAENFNNPDQVASLIAEIQACVRIPAFIAVDEEGGRVSRLQRSSKMKASAVPSAARLGSRGALAVKYAYTLIGRELAVLGVNMNFAPVADLPGLSTSDIVGDRGFSADPQQNAFFCTLAVKALRLNGIVPVVKHFPGHGRSSGDSHFLKEQIDISYDELKKTDLVPFEAAFKAGADAVMTAHIEYPQLDSQAVPVSMSKKILDDLLQKDLGFKGIIITDALNMKGAEGYGSEQDAVTQSLEAGSDMLLCPPEPLVLKTELAQKIKTKDLSRGLLGSKVRKILALKAQYRILGFYKSEFIALKTGPQDAYFDQLKPSQVFGSKIHRKILENFVLNP